MHQGAPFDGLLYSARFWQIYLALVFTMFLHCEPFRIDATNLALQLLELAQTRLEEDWELLLPVVVPLALLCVLWCFVTIVGVFGKPLCAAPRSGGIELPTGSWPDTEAFWDGILPEKRTATPDTAPPPPPEPQQLSQPLQQQQPVAGPVLPVDHTTICAPQPVIAAEPEPKEALVDVSAPVDDSPVDQQQIIGEDEMLKSEDTRTTFSTKERLLRKLRQRRIKNERSALLKSAADVAGSSSTAHSAVSAAEERNNAPGQQLSWRRRRAVRPQTSKRVRVSMQWHAKQQRSHSAHVEEKTMSDRAMAPQPAELYISPDMVHNGDKTVNEHVDTDEKVTEPLTSVAEPQDFLPVAHEVSGDNIALSSMLWAWRHNDGGDDIDSDLESELDELERESRGEPALLTVISNASTDHHPAVELTTAEEMVRVALDALFLSHQALPQHEIERDQMSYEPVESETLATAGPDCTSPIESELATQMDNELDHQFFEPFLSLAMDDIVEQSMPEVPDEEMAGDEHWQAQYAQMDAVLRESNWAVSEMHGLVSEQEEHELYCGGSQTVETEQPHQFGTGVGPLPSLQREQQQTSSFSFNDIAVEDVLQLAADLRIESTQMVEQQLPYWQDTPAKNTVEPPTPLWQNGPVNLELDNLLLFEAEDMASEDAFVEPQPAAPAAAAEELTSHPQQPPAFDDSCIDPQLLALPAETQSTRPVTRVQRHVATVFEPFDWLPDGDMEDASAAPIPEPDVLVAVAAPGPQSEKQEAPTTAECEMTAEEIAAAFAEPLPDADLDAEDDPALNEAGQKVKRKKPDDYGEVQIRKTVYDSGLGKRLCTAKAQRDKHIAHDLESMATPVALPAWVVSPLIYPDPSRNPLLSEHNEEEAKFLMYRWMDLNIRAIATWDTCLPSQVYMHNKQRFQQWSDRLECMIEILFEDDGKKAPPYARGDQLPVFRERFAEVLRDEKATVDIFIEPLTAIAKVSFEAKETLRLAQRVQRALKKRRAPTKSYVELMAEASGR